jgi:hypothetical protein
MSENEVRIRKADPTEGFDRTEPSSGPIWAFTIASVLVLVVVIWALQQYFDKVWNEAVYEKVLAPPSEELKTVRGRDDWDLSHSMYLDKKSGQVRIPLDRAQDLFLKEVAAGKPFYPGKPTLPKKEEPDTNAAAAPGAAAPAPATK